MIAQHLETNFHPSCRATSGTSVEKLHARTTRLLFPQTKPSKPLSSFPDRPAHNILAAMSTGLLPLALVGLPFRRSRKPPRDVIHAELIQTSIIVDGNAYARRTARGFRETITTYHGTSGSTDPPASVQRQITLVSNSNFVHSIPSYNRHYILPFCVKTPESTPQPYTLRLASPPPCDACCSKANKRQCL